MSKQTTMFEQFNAQLLSRSSDEPTSKAAAAELVGSGKHSRQMQIVLAELRKFPGRTSRQLAEASGLDRHMIARRLPDMEKLKLCRKGARQETGVTWWPN